MTRTRTVFPRDTVAHHFAHGIGDSARDSAHTFYFTGPTLYSYGGHFAIAHRLSGPEYGALDGRVIWNDASYSNTTSTHKSHAWRALTRQQKDSSINVPSLSQDSAREIDRALAAKRLPEFAESLIRAVRDNVRAIDGKRHGSGPFTHSLHLARTYQSSALAFYAHAKRKYPLPMLPESDADVPADKKARSVFIASYARAIVESEYRDALKSALGYFEESRAVLAADGDGTQYTDPRTLARVAGGTYSVSERAHRAAQDAAQHYAILNPGKKSRAVLKLLADLAPVMAALKARKDAADRADDLAKLERFTRVFYRQMRDHKISDTPMRAIDLPWKRRTCFPRIPCAWSARRFSDRQGN